MTSKAFGLAQLGNAYSDGALSNRNLIINGAMQVAQRGTSFTTSNGIYTLDRWRAFDNVNSLFDIETSSEAPSGYKTSVKITSNSARSTSTNDLSSFYQKVENQNSYQLSWGTSNAKNVAVSFWVKSSLTGTFAVVLQNSNQDYGCPIDYEITSANTWEYKTIVVPAPTGGTWNNASSNGVGIQLAFPLNTGSSFQATQGSWTSGSIWQSSTAINLANTSGATFYLTGVQLEVGDTATPFEHRSYGQELALCQRYYERQVATATGVRFASGNANGSTTLTAMIPFLAQKRATPTLSYSDIVVRQGGSNTNISSVSVVGTSSMALTADVTTSTSITTGESYHIRASSSGSYLSFDAEL